MVIFLATYIGIHKKLYIIGSPLLPRLLDNSALAVAQI